MSFAFALDVDWSSLFSGDLTFDFDTNLSGMFVNVNLDSLFGSLAAGVNWLRSGLDLSGLNLNWSRWDLSGIDFSGINLSGIDFSWANLRGVNFSGVNLNLANLRGAFAFDVDWSGVTGILSDISGMFSKIRFGSLPSASFGVPIHWTGGLDLSGLNLNWSGWDLSGIDFSGFRLDNINLRWANLTGVNFSGVTFGFDLDWTGSIWKDITFPSGTLSGIFRNVNFSGFSWNANINWNLAGYLPDFSGLKLSGSSGAFHFFDGLHAAWSALGLNAPKLNFRWADFSGLDLTGLLDGLSFQFGDFRGVSFKNFKLPSLPSGDWDLSGLNFSLSDWSGFSIGGGTKLRLDLGDLSGANIAGLLNSIASAAGTFYDKLTSFSGFSASYLTQYGMNEAVVENVLGTPLTGPAFAFTPIFKPNGTTDVTLGFRLQVNQDLMPAVAIPGRPGRRWSGGGGGDGKLRRFGDRQGAIARRPRSGCLGRRAARTPQRRRDQHSDAEFSRTSRSKWGSIASMSVSAPACTGSTPNWTSATSARCHLRTANSA